MMLDANEFINTVRARSYSPRKKRTVSQWAADERLLSKKSSPEPGPWRNDRNPPLVEIMDCLSVSSPIHEVVVKFPIQFGKTEIGVNWLGYLMDEIGGPVMVCLPGEVSLKKWINQKLNPMVDETAAVKRALTTINSRDSSNTKDFKDFIGGQLYMEHAGSPARLKSTTVRFMIVDELTEFAANLNTGDDPLMMLEDRTSAYPHSYKRLYISSPGIAGVCRTDYLYERSDKRRYFMPCVHCEHEITFKWSGLHWDSKGKDVRYVCPECGAEIKEHYKTDMIKAGRWIAENTEIARRGYTINCLYYQFGLGPTWSMLVEMFRDVCHDPAGLKVFMNSRLAEVFEDPAMRAVKMNVIQDRAEPYRLRIAPMPVCQITAGVDTQDDRLEAQIIGWGKGMASWTLDYVVIPGDPELWETWLRLADLLNTPIQHESGQLLQIQATAIDCGGHRTEAVKNFVRKRLIKRPMAIFGAIPNNAQVLSRPKAQDVTWNGKTDKKGVFIQHIGTVAIKHMLFGRLSADNDKSAEDRQVHFSEDLDNSFFSGIVSESYDPRGNRFIKKKGARNEPLDTWVYSYAATHHQELRLQTWSDAKWDAMRPQIIEGKKEHIDSIKSQTPTRSLPPIRKPLHGRKFRI